MFIFVDDFLGSDSTSPQQGRQMRNRQNDLTNVINLGGGSVTPGMTLS